MSIWKKKSKIMVTCPKGVVPYLKEEIQNLGFPVLEESDTTIRTEGTLQDTMVLNLYLRTAQRVFYCIKNCIVNTPEMLYQRIHSIDWENILYCSGEAAYFCVTSLADNPLISDSRFVNVKTKDAIVDRLRTFCNQRPDSGPARDKAVVHVYWKKNYADIYLDTSGERLSLRGYRKIPLLAPLQESLAAAIIMAAPWKRDEHFINPMCGSGTLAIEAALIALNRAPGIFRNHFGFMYIKDFPEDDWNRLRKQARNGEQKDLSMQIIATDIDKNALTAARKNAKAAGVDNFIEFKVCHYSKTPLPEGRGLIVLNPPYGGRMEGAASLKTSAHFPERKEKLVDGHKVIIRKAFRKKDVKTVDPQTLRNLEETYQGIGNF